MKYIYIFRTRAKEKMKFDNDFKLGIFIILFTLFILNCLKDSKYITPSPSFQFYLHELPYDETCLYTREIYQVLKDHPLRTLDLYQASIVFMMYSNENAYRHGTCESNYARTSTDACLRVSQFIHQNYKVRGNIKNHFIFYGSDVVDPNDSHCAHVVNLPYMFLTRRMYPSNDKRQGELNAVEMSKQYNASTILLPPPDTTSFQLDYSRKTWKRGQDKYWISFKGSLDHGYARSRVLELMQPILSEDIIIEDTLNTSHTYEDLMLNSSFLLHIDGDLPWSYRFTEILKSGAMPVMIDHEYVIYPFSQLINWDLAFVRVPLENVDSIDKILASFDDETLKLKYDYLEYIVKTYLYDRETQMNWLLYLLE